MKEWRNEWMNKTSSSHCCSTSSFDTLLYMSQPDKYSHFLHHGVLMSNSISANSANVLDEEPTARKHPGWIKFRFTQKAKCTVYSLIPNSNLYVKRRAWLWGEMTAQTCKIPKLSKVPCSKGLSEAVFWRGPKTFECNLILVLPNCTVLCKGKWLRRGHVAKKFDCIHLVRQNERIVWFLPRNLPRGIHFQVTPRT